MLKANTAREKVSHVSSIMINGTIFCSAYSLNYDLPIASQ